MKLVKYSINSKFQTIIIEKEKQQTYVTSFNILCCMRRQSLNCDSLVLINSTVSVTMSSLTKRQHYEPTISTNEMLFS